MIKIKVELKNVLKDTLSTTFTLLKIMIPVSIIVKILSEYGLVDIIGEFLQPIMNIIGLPGELSLVWATTMISNIYGGLIVFFNLSSFNTYTIAQVTILSSIMLIAHTLPIELSIVQKAGVRLWYIFLLRTGSALIFGFILSSIFITLNIYQKPAEILWKPLTQNTTLLGWVLNEIKNYLMIFLIIFGLILLMKILKKTGIIEKLNNKLEPGLEYLGMSKQAAPITIIGTTLGIAYGGGLIIKEARSRVLSKKDVFLSLSLMSLSHSLIEDTLLMISIGASLFGILFGRIFFTIFVMIIMIKLIKKISKEKFEKYFVSI
jgi:hypothetical protein